MVVRTSAIWMFGACLRGSCYVDFFFTDPATTEIYTLSLHDALPIFDWCVSSTNAQRRQMASAIQTAICLLDRKSTRLNSSHVKISYAVFCLKKKKTIHRRNVFLAKTQTTPLPV